MRGYLRRRISLISETSWAFQGDYEKWRKKVPNRKTSSHWSSAEERPSWSSGHRRPLQQLTILGDDVVCLCACEWVVVKQISMGQREVGPCNKSPTNLSFCIREFKRRISNLHLQRLKKGNYVSGITHSFLVKLSTMVAFQLVSHSQLPQDVATRIHLSI